MPLFEIFIFSRSYQPRISRSRLHHLEHELSKLGGVEPEMTQKYHNCQIVECWSLFLEANLTPKTIIKYHRDSGRRLGFTKFLFATHTSFLATWIYVCLTCPHRAFLGLIPGHVPGFSTQKQDHLLVIGIHDVGLWTHTLEAAHPKSSRPHLSFRIAAWNIPRIHPEPRQHFSVSIVGVSCFHNCRDREKSKHISLFEFFWFCQGTSNSSKISWKRGIT